MKVITLIVLIILLPISACGEKQNNMNEVSKQSKKVLEVLVQWVNERYSRDQYYDLVDLEDIDLGKSVDNSLVDETGNLRDWLIASPGSNIKKIDFSKRKDKFINFAGRDGIIYALWFYPELKGEPPVIKFTEYYPVVVASSLAEFACRLGRESIKNQYSFEYWSGLMGERFNEKQFEKAKKLLEEDYNFFRKRLAKVVDCSHFINHAELMQRHDVVLVPQLSFKADERDLTGDDIVELINVSISDKRVLNALHKFGFHTPLYPLKDDDFDTGTSSIKNVGISFGFSDVKETNTQKNDKAETLYLNDIEFDYSFNNLPFKLANSDTIDTVSKKLSTFKAYTDPDSESSRYWYPSGKDYHIRIDFEDDKPKELYAVTIQTYWSPSRLGLIPVK